MASSGMNNLTTLIKRLEAATSRLEDIASSALPDEDRPRRTESKLSNGDQKIHAAAINLGQTTSTLSSQESTTAQGSNQTLPSSIQAFDLLVSEELQPFETNCRSIGSHVELQGTAFCNAFRAQRNVLLVATKSTRPPATSTAFQGLLKPLFDGVASIVEIKDQNRKDSLEDNLCMLEAGAQIIGWVQLDSSPVGYIDDILGSAQFYGNKILRAFRETDQSQVNWVKGFVKLIGSLKTYIKQNHPNGVSWNNHGLDIEKALDVLALPGSQIDKSGERATGEAISAPPPPPPPPPPPLPTFDLQEESASSKSSGATDMGAVFEQLNRGEAVTGGLRKVDKSQMTHKNPALRARSSGPIEQHSASSRGKSPTPPIKQKPESMRAKKPVRKELDGNKWIVEQVENETSPIEVSAERQQSILISRCRSAVIKVNGKANAISVNNCSRVDIILDSLVSSMEVINTSNFRMQVTGSIPAVQLDKVDGATLYLSLGSLGTEVYTSKCTGINITLPPDSEEDDSTECPVPEQIRTSVINGSLVSEIVKQEG